MKEPPTEFIRNPGDAELRARELMEFMGFADAQIGPRGPDGGVDVTSSRAVAQVKAQMKPTGRPVIQALHGVASLQSRPYS